MKKTLILFSALFATLISCTKVIDLDLREAEPKLVVEALLSDETEPFKVKLSMLAPYFSGSNPLVTNASVFISDQTGHTDTLYYTSNGYYETNGNRQTSLGYTYTLLVEYEGQRYQASSSVPAYKMPLDTITYIYNEESLFLDEGYNVILNAQDNALTEDYYRFLFWRNDTLQTEPFKYYVTDDKNIQGNYISAQVPYNYLSGDVARVEIQCLDRGYYLYLTAVSTQYQSSGSPFDAPPSNPPTNLSNGALGYFAAVSKNSKSIVLP